jgi:predicted PurR-regulated permease PerM
MAEGQSAAAEPFYQGRQFRIWMLALTGVAILVFAGILRSVTTPIVVSLVIAYVLDPVVVWLQGRRLRRWTAVVLVYAAFLAVVAIALVAVVPPVVRQVARLPSYAEQLSRRVQQAEDAEAAEDATQAEAPAEGAPPAGGAGPGEEDLLAAALETARRNVDKIAARALSVFRTVVEQVAASVGQVVGAFIQVLLVFVYTFFFLLGLHPFYDRLRRYLPGRYRDEILRIVGRLDSAYSNFFRGRIIVALCSGAITSLGLLIVGIPFWLLIGMTVGVLGIIPFVGVLLGLIPAAILGFVAGGWGTVVGVLVVFAVAQMLEPLLTPLILSRGLKLHPVTILIGLLVGGRLFGLFGAVISVPLVSTAQILSEEFLLPPLRELADEEPAAAAG